MMWSMKGTTMKWAPTGGGSAGGRAHSDTIVTTMVVVDLSIVDVNRAVFASMHIACTIRCEHSTSYSRGTR